MNQAPLEIAIKEISEARSLLGSLITSSETFDYPKAKLALKQLDRKLRQLRRIQTHLQGHSRVPLAPNIHVIDFSAPVPKDSPQASPGK